LYREQLEQFPQAKCFLNVHDPAKWFDSVSRAWEMLKSVKNAKFISCLFNINETLDYVQHRFGGFPEKEKWVNAYQEHIDEVKKNVSPDRLIVYRVEEGWEPVCSFLNLPVPDKDFPRENVGSVESIMKKISSLLTVDIASA
jgi:hypothetical protein